MKKKYRALKLCAIAVAFCIFVLLVGCFFSCFLCDAEPAAKMTACNNNLLQMRTALESYAEQWGSVPLDKKGNPSLKPLASIPGDFSPYLISCPAVGRKDGNIDYIISPRYSLDSAPGDIIVIDKPGNHPRSLSDGNSLRVDGRVDRVSMGRDEYAHWAALFRAGKTTRWRDWEEGDGDMDDTGAPGDVQEHGGAERGE